MIAPLPQCVRSLSVTGLLLLVSVLNTRLLPADNLVFTPPGNPENARQIVLVAGDEEYRSEEAMPMLAKILSQKHGFRCTVVFAMGPDGADYIDSNNQEGLRGLDALDTADLMIIGTRFRHPSPEQAAHVTAFLNAGKPVIGIRTSTHAFRGGDKFGETLTFDQFGLKVLGEQWVSHHGRHKAEGARGVIEPSAAHHPILLGVNDVFAPSDVYGVIHLTDADQILLRGAITQTLDPASAILMDDDRNKPMQPFAWLHEYTTPDGKAKGKSFCTTAGAAVDFVSEDLRRLVVNAALYLTDREVPAKADVAYVDPFYPSFYGFINDKTYWKNANVKPADFGLGKSPWLPDPPGSPAWPFRPIPPGQ
ncbi:MAG: ThuA domain-containing protein [Planctomycetaceae bacterium]|nr:ThuA domain-containing protein [Planctomycetaceae bacterium]